MIRYLDLGKTRFSRNRILVQRILEGDIGLGGNKRLGIYGALNCSSGKRMKDENRVFFKNREEAFNKGFRPCGHCLKGEYSIWKDSILKSS